MNQSISLKRGIVIFGIPASILTVLAVLMTSQYVTVDNTLALAFTIDLVVVVPLVYYALIRKTTIPATTVVPVVVAGLALGSFLLPADNQLYLTFFKTWGLPFVELFVIGYIILKIRNAVTLYKQERGYAPDFLTAVTRAAEQILPKGLARAFATEIAVFYYTFYAWRSSELQTNHFSYHKKSGSGTIYSAFLLLISVETIVVHLLIEQWNSTLAWVLSIVGVYTAIQIVGLIKSMARRPIIINQSDVSVRYGLFFETTIPLTKIKSCELIHSSTFELPDDCTSISPISDFEKQNILLELHTKHVLTGPYGITKSFTNLTLYVDEPHRFAERVESLVSDSSI